MDNYTKSYGRIAGVGYLTIAVFGAFSIGYVPSVIDVSGDPAETVANILNNRVLYASGQIGDVVVLLAEIMVSVMLFHMFRNVSTTLAGIASASRLMMVAVMSTMLFFTSMTLSFANSVEYLTVFSHEQLAALALLATETHHVGVKIWELFFWVHLAVLGVLVMRSVQAPTILGWALLVGSFGYLLDAVTGLVAPSFSGLDFLEVGLLVIVTIGEVSFALWLVIFGIKTK